MQHILLNYGMLVHRIDLFIIVDSVQDQIKLNIFKIRLGLVRQLIIGI